MKILILTEGGKDIGFGHIARCIALSDAGTVMGMETGLIINGDKSVLGLLKGKDYQIFDWTKGGEILFYSIRNADAVIVDSYLAERTLYDRIIKSFDGRLLMIDDYRRIKYPKGIVLNPAISSEKLDYPRRDGVTYLLGKNYIIVRKEFWSVPRKHIRRKIKDVLITLGGI
jgi:spore coat polysaccharide biosynthesis predicted glycosyltransferase SpsG